MANVTGQRDFNNRTDNYIVARGTKALHTLSNLSTFPKEREEVGAILYLIVGQVII